MKHCVKKIAICYYGSTKTVLRRNHVKVVTKEVELFSLEPRNEARKYVRKPLFCRV